MKLDGYSSLTEMARKAPMTPQTVQQFRNAALQTVDHAIDVFFKPEREVAEGKSAYDAMTDLERSLRAYSNRLQGETTVLNQQFDEKIKELTVETKKEEHVQGESLLPDGKPLKDGTRTTTPAYNYNRGEGKVDVEVSHIKNLVEKMGSVLPLYGSVAMVPGPLSVSLKDHIKETMKYSLQGHAESRSTMEQESFRLLTLSAGKKQVTTVNRSDVNAGAKSETTTIDERVMPGMHDIRTAIAGLGFSKAQDQKYSVRQEVVECDRRQETQGMLWWKKEVTVLDPVNRGQAVAYEVSLPVVPDRMTLYSVAGNQGLEKPGAGAELVDFVDQAQLTPEFVDQLREKAQGVLDQAVGTLFNPQREVGEGRKSYDQLANLERALRLAQARWGKESYNSVLDAQIQALHEVTPLFASVAMVPGEMSSSVKNHAKELFEAYYDASSSSVTRGRDLHGSVLTLGMSETRGLHSEGSDLSASFRRETTTTDERIMPKLHSIQVQLDQLQIAGDKLVIPAPRTERW